MQLRRSLRIYVHENGPPVPKRSKISRVKNQFEVEDFCCGKRKFLKPLPLECVHGCTILPFKSYFCYNKKLCFCNKCHRKVRSGKSAILYVTKRVTVRKGDCIKLLNNGMIEEPVIVCSSCRKKFHKVCVLHLETIYGLFTCADCSRVKNLSIHNVNVYNVESLPKTLMGDHIQVEVQSFLAQNKVDNKVTIRVVISNNAKLVPNIGCESHRSLPYKNKMVIAFEKIGGVDIAFFSFIVQEYYSNCPGPNRNCVYLAYLDSVQAFQPHELRTQVYHTILLAYFKYVKLLGFKCVYIWACPPGPSSGYDYIFYSHPPAMKMPTLKRLKAWYTNLLRIGQGKGIITGHSNLLVDTMKNNITRIADLAYFHEDHWIDFVQGIIAHPPTTPTEGESMRCPKVRCRKMTPGKLKAKKFADEFNEFIYSVSDYRMQCVLREMKFRGDMFLVAHLNDNIPGSTRTIVDPDPELRCPILDSRDVFMLYLRQNHYEFSSLRRGKYSTMTIIYNIHMFDMVDRKKEILCNLCLAVIKYGYDSCTNFHLCSSCLEKSGKHNHSMNEESMSSSTSELSSTSETYEVESWAGQDLTFTEVSHILKAVGHAITCQCVIKGPSCTLGQNLLCHLEKCAKPRGTCIICVRIFSITCSHCSSCPDVKCELQVCRNVKLFQQTNKFLTERTCTLG
ncbi:CREB-binding protein [Folsomia candida]|uniref:histone acetyltransferase n=1 Tax=Folsomia candida TaxID=158441 RepID=A0A226EJ20_FOLCA|nr:CREB-binding protein [Folsomia candida]XP_035705980.1 CREB-binding protein [Folsomia candida]OXA57107.1 CREB-binding protein [Folsomia candida]